MSITVKLDYETIDHIIQAQLVETWEGLKSDLGSNGNIFVWGDPEADDAMIQKHIDALELLLKWYSTPDQLKELGITLSDD
jgi:hypothetical protein